jgi:hypothetical protein
LIILNKQRPWWDACAEDQWRAGDSIVDNGVHDGVPWVRRQLPVPGAWGYRRRGDAVIVVADQCYTDDEVRRLVELTRLKLSCEDADGG